MVDSIQIISDRLILRPIRLDDSDLIFKYRSDSITNKYQSWIPKTAIDVQNFIKTKVSSEIDIPDTWFGLAIIKKENGELIGDVGIHFLKTDKYQAEIGCTINKNFHRMGYASEALKKTINYLFNKLNKRRIIASIDPRNVKSIEMIERLGFRKEAHFRESIFFNNEWVDDLVYAILKDEWNKKNN